MVSQAALSVTTVEGQDISQEQELCNRDGTSARHMLGYLGNTTSCSEAKYNVVAMVLGSL